VQIFDSWGGVLSTPDYQEFSLRYMHKIIAGLHKTYDGQTIPVIMFTKGGAQWLESMLNVDDSCKPHALGMDWTCSLSQAKQRVGQQVALQGNLDPCALYGSDESLQAAAKEVLNDFYNVDSNSFGHVFNLGHGIHPGIEPEKVKLLVDTVHSYSTNLITKT